MHAEEKCPFLSIEHDMGATIRLCGKAEGKICDNCKSAKTIVSALLLGSFISGMFGGYDDAAD